MNVTSRNPDMGIINLGPLRGKSTIMYSTGGKDTLHVDRIAYDVRRFSTRVISFAPGEEDPTLQPEQLLTMTKAAINAGANVQIYTTGAAFAPHITEYAHVLIDLTDEIVPNQLNAIKSYIYHNKFSGNVSAVIRGIDKHFDWGKFKGNLSKTNLPHEGLTLYMTNSEVSFLNFGIDVPAPVSCKETGYDICRQYGEVETRYIKY